MQFLALLALAGLVSAGGLTNYGPYGDIQGTPSIVQENIPMDATVASISCRGNHRLDFVEVIYRVVDHPTGQINLKTASYGAPQGGNFQGRVDTTRSGEVVSQIIPYVCSDGKARGLVCGLRIVFSHGSVLKCGIDATSGHAKTPSSIADTKRKRGTGHTVSVFHAFYAETIKGGSVISKIGYTFKDQPV